MLQNQTLVGGVWTPSDVRAVNDTGTPLVSAASNGSGEAIADDYTLAFDTVVAGTSANVTINTTSPNNPYKGRVRAILLDGVTVYSNIIAGVDLVFSNNGGFLASWTATVHVGEYLGTYDAFGGSAGVPSAGERNRVVNTGTGAASNCKARLLTEAVLVRKVGSGIFNYIKQFAEGATEKQAGGGSQRVMPYNITVANVTGVGAAKVADVLVDGVLLPAGSVRNLATGATTTGAGLKAVTPAYAYRIITGPLTGVEFALSAAVAAGDTANIMVFNSRFVQIAPDVAGAEGAYDTVDVVLTQAGQAAGVIQPAGEAFYWRRVLVPAGANSESNPYPANVALQGTETGQANWLG